MNERKGGITFNKDLLGTDPTKQEHERYIVLDESGEENHLDFDVSWNDASKNRDKIRLTDQKTGKRYVIDKNQLMSILFIIGDEQDQMKFMKEHLSTITMQRKVITTTLKQNHKKGDILNIFVDIPVEINESTKRLKPESQLITLKKN